jgi:hypothetical protein
MSVSHRSISLAPIRQLLNYSITHRPDLAPCMLARVDAFNACSGPCKAPVQIPRHVVGRSGRFDTPAGFHATQLTRAGLNHRQAFALPARYSRLSKPLAPITRNLGCAPLNTARRPARFSACWCRLPDPSARRPSARPCHRATRNPSSPRFPTPVATRCRGRCWCPDAAR